jgi:hypothetical protein
VLFHDYIWQLDETGMKLDGELDVESLGWQHGDYFKFVEHNGVKRLVNDHEELYRKLIANRAKS